MDTDVLIVGAGPTGLTLAIDLGRRGVKCIVVEQKDAPQFLPKMERCNARTMEFFRRLGVSERIRAAGLPVECPMDVFIVLSCVQPPLLHTHYPSVAEARSAIAACNDGSQPLEPYQLISQYTLEPILKSVAESLPSVTVRYGTRFESFEQDAEGVTAWVASDRGGVPIKARYLVGCDGGSSVVRQQLGIKLSGEANILQLRQALYYCKDLYDRIPIGKGRHYHVADAQATFLIVQDSTKHFTLHSVVDEDADMATKFEEAVGMPVNYEMLYVGKWRQNLLLADRYQEGRVFLAGDAVHLMIPTGGLGMNSGAGDAIDLGWKLAATLQGWGGPNLLRSYETERRPIGEQNVAASRFASLGRRKWRAMYQPNIRDATPSGEESRRALARVAEIEQRKGNEMIGAELSYRYVNSPLIAAEDTEPPEFSFTDYIPSTYPGTRLPHVWLADGVAMQDCIGNDLTYSLLQLRADTVDTSSIEKAFARRSAPFRKIVVPEAVARDVYGCNFILLRPDMHIVWRGNELPEKAEGLAAMATGFAA